MAGGKTFFQSQQHHFFLFFSFRFPFLPVPFLLTFGTVLLPFLQYSSIPAGIPDFSPTTSSLFFGSAKAATLSWLALFYSVVLPYTYYADSTNRLCDFRILEFISFLGFCFLPTHGCSAVATGKYPPNTIPNKYFCIKMSHFDYDKHYID